MCSTGGGTAFGVVSFCGYGTHFVNVAAHGIADLIKTAVSVEAGINLSGKICQVHLAELVFQQFSGLKGSQLFRAFLIDQADALEAAAAVLAALKQADVGAHSL